MTRRVIAKCGAFALYGGQGVLLKGCLYHVNVAKTHARHVDFIGFDGTDRQQPYFPYRRHYVFKAGSRSTYRNRISAGECGQDIRVLRHFVQCFVDEANLAVERLGYCFYLRLRSIFFRARDDDFGRHVNTDTRYQNQHDSGCRQYREQSFHSVSPNKKLAREDLLFSYFF